MKFEGFKKSNVSHFTIPHIMGILDSRDFVLSLRVQEVMDFDA